MVCKYRSILIIMLLAANCAWSQAIKKPDANTTYFKQISELASRSDTKAQVCLGELYTDGIGTQKNLNLALKWYRKAADSGDPSGELHVGQVYAWGIGVNNDTNRGLKIFHDLVKQGYMPAATEIGVLYVSGDGVPKSKNQALELYRKAAAVGDYWAEVRIGLMYHFGSGVNKDEHTAQIWLKKAANHQIYCLADFGRLIPFIINGYMKPYKNNDSTSIGTVGIKYKYHNKRAEDVVIMTSSGYPEVDKDWLDATRNAILPPWPAGFHTDDKTLGFWIMGSDGGLNPDFIGNIRNAIKTAMVMPKEVLVNGSKGKGIATVSFYYLDGKDFDVNIVASSDDNYEDAEAISAVERASYPPTPSTYKHKKLHLTIELKFLDITPAKIPASINAPRTSTKGP